SQPKVGSSLCPAAGGWDASRETVNAPDPRSFAAKVCEQAAQRAIAESLGLSQGAVSGYLSRARAAGVSWPLAEGLDDVQLEALLFPPPPAIAADQRPVPDWAWVHREL